MSKSEDVRLNPFAFPTDTDFRFILLIVSVLGASLFVFKWLYFGFTETRMQYVARQVQCFEARPITDFSNLDSFITPENRAAQLAYERCRAPAEMAIARWAIGGLTLLIAVAVLIYLTYPARIMRRKKLVPLSAEDAPEVSQYLHELCQETGIQQDPDFLWNPLNPSIGGLAFGRRGRYAIALTGGLVTRFYTDRPSFRAVVLHELAHIYNADIDKTYITQSIWQAFLYTVLPAFLINLVMNRDWSLVFSLSWRVLSLLLLVYLVRNGILRVREIYADVRASFWERTKEALLKILASLPKPRIPRWRKSMLVHPDPTARALAIDDTGRLFPMSTWDVFATGMAATLALPSVLSILGSLLTSAGLIFYAPLLSGFIFAPLAMAIVGVGIWRMTFAEHAQGKDLRGIWRLALAFAMGIVAGNLVSFESLLLLEMYEGFEFFFIFSYVIWITFLLLAVMVLIWWIAVSASAWVNEMVRLRSPRLLIAIGLLLAGFIFALLTGILFQFLGDPFMVVVLFVIGPLATLGYITESPITFLSLATLWFFPLLSWFWGKRVASREVSGEWFQPGSARPGELHIEDVPNPNRALLVGLITGIVYTFLLLVVRILARLVFSEALRDTDQYKLSFYMGTVALAVMIQGIAAFLVALQKNRFGPILGLFAAFCAACVMVVGSLGLNLLFGGSIDFRFAWDTFSFIVNIGALFAIPSVIVASALASRVRGLLQTQQLPAKGLAA